MPGTMLGKRESTRGGPGPRALCAEAEKQTKGEGGVAVLPGKSRDHETAPNFP